MDEVCEFPGCRKPVRARRLCIGHLSQEYRGLPLTPLKPYRTRRKLVEAPEGFAFCTNHQGFELLEKFYKRPNGSPKNICKTCTVAQTRKNEERRRKAA